MAVKKKTKSRAKTAARKKPAAKRKAKAPAKRKVAKKAKKSTSKRKSSGLSKLSYTLSAELQAIVGSKTATRPEVVKKLWAYIKSHKCQDTKNKRMIIPDHKLGEVIGKKPIDMMKLAGMLSKHLK